MNEYREVTRAEREQMMADGVFDINGNIAAHPGYTGIHRRRDGTYWFRGVEVTDPESIYAIEHRHDPKTPVQPAPPAPASIWQRLKALFIRQAAS